MPKITDTYELAYACCETVLKELGRFPTIELIRERIGVNSPNTIKKAMNDWTAAFARHYVEQLEAPQAFPGVPERLSVALVQLWAEAVAESRRAAAGQEAVLQEEITRLQCIIEQQQTALAEAGRAMHQASGHVAELEAKVAAITAESRRLQAELKTASDTVEHQKQHNIALGEQHRQQLQQEQQWMQRRILEERELAEAKSRDKHQQLEDRIIFLTASREQAVQAQKFSQAHNRQLLDENAQLKSTTAADALPHWRFKRKGRRE